MYALPELEDTIAAWWRGIAEHMRQAGAPALPEEPEHPSDLGPVEVHRAFSTAAAKWIMALKLESVLSDLMAIRLNSLSLQKKFSIRWRHLYISASIFNGWIRRGCWEITILAPRSSRSSMMTLLSKALSAMNASKLTPSRSGLMPMVS